MITERISLPAPAKINLFLHITGRRPDGYHLLQTVFQLLEFGDELALQANTSGEITLSPAIEGVANEDNLIVRAARALQQQTGCRYGADIELTKVLPMGGGLGGGSSNAATALVGLNHLWQTGLSLDQLAELGLALGADVPVFVKGQSSWAEGVGEQLSPIATPEAWYVVLTPDASVNTGQIFQHPALTRDTAVSKMRAFSAAELDTATRNDCQPLVTELYPEVQDALDWLSQFSPSARMTGTGASVFARFDSEAAAHKVLEKKPKKHFGFAAKSANISPLHRTLQTTVQH